MKKASELSELLAKSNFKEFAEKFADFMSYFENEQLLQRREAQVLIEKITEELDQECQTNSNYFNYYVSSYFKDNKKEDEKKKSLEDKLRQLCEFMSQHQSQDVILSLNEFLSLYPSLPFAKDIINLNSSNHVFSNDYVKKIHLKYFCGNINNNNNTLKSRVNIEWNEFRKGLELYLKELSKNESVDIDEIIINLKTLIDSDSDNMVSLQDFDKFFSQHNNLNLILKEAQKNRYGSSSYYQNSPFIQLTKYPKQFNQFYQQLGAKGIAIKPFYTKNVLGRDKRQLTLSDLNKQQLSQKDQPHLCINNELIFSSEDMRISRQQFTITKDDNYNYFIQNNSNQSHFRLTRSFIVRKGYIFKYYKKISFLIESLYPQSESFVPAKSELHSIQDYPSIQLHADFDVAALCKSQKNVAGDQQVKPFLIVKGYKQFRVEAGNKLTIGGSNTDTIYIENGEESQLVFEYLDNYAWIVTEKSKPIYPYLLQESRINKEELFEKSNDTNEIELPNKLELQQFQQLKFKIFEGMTFTFSDYEGNFTFQEK